MAATPHPAVRRSIVPPYLLARLARVDDPRFAVAADAARQSLLTDVPLRGIREGEPPAHPRRGAMPAPDREPGLPQRWISDAAGLEILPGRLVRSEGNPATGDPAVDEAYDGLGHTHALFWTQFGLDSIDGVGLPLEASVHYGHHYDNAFWDGRRMVFGDGDGEVFTRFTASLSVIGHELAHGVIQYSANLPYQGQSGALNESISDVFGALVEQHALGQDVASASWLIGEGLFTDQVEGRAIRSMKAPGTAYDDDVLGTDPQPASMDGYIDTDEDNGGVHLNSGIPNRAFYLVADALGGNAWEAAGHIWFDTVMRDDLPTTVDFAGFARATIEVAAERHGAGSREADAVVVAWESVGVLLPAERSE
ncbi:MULTISPECIES: M4 family metallopeptidase [unclassified Salinibacterium]|uniref:M4 family metallopeptidase n=1 Tax=unclassified Salinibacterium TaxID=2632331 RepID=UPI00141FAAAC|nr:MULTISPECIES: M4 family metallopeptidase [unclassified Salinibacterium]